MQEKETKTQEQKRAERKSMVYTLLIAAAVAVLLRVFVFEFANVKGPSMQPTLYTGETVFIEKVSYRFTHPSLNDVIVCDFPNLKDAAIKRVMGLPGDQVAIHGGVFYLNGEQYLEDVFQGTIEGDMEEWVVPEGHVFVMGDNRNHSTDSRSLSCGPIPYESVIGRSLFVLLPLDKMAWL